MFKFVVLCAFVAAATATATPDIITPFTYSSNVLAPATTFVTGYPNKLVYSSPYISSPSYYSSSLGYSHLIKKRSAPLAVSSYIAPSAYVTPAAYASAPLAATYTAAAPFLSTYAAGAPLAASYAAAPFAYGNPIYSSAAYLIKK
ncbi:pupal cuticle protein G1A-like [Melitaea cinxia]|uniref:pupal cuticle protein G1A-like n=1 Tax=Melitaea cinxia TaxID=113334 RepID=UPI001E273A88|nr:pupal cuticle protein G1A-like [Melitaea cinxia]